MKKDKMIITSIIIIAIIMIIVFTIFVSYQYEDNDQKTNDFEEEKQLEFTLDIEDTSGDLDNISFYYQLKNISDRPFNFSEPDFGKNLNLFITATNGTEYHYVGPVIPLVIWKHLSAGEIYSGEELLTFQIHSWSWGENYTHWKNSTTGEYWFFQPGTYVIYGEYESIPHYYMNDVIVGIWYSNVITLTIE